MNQSPSSRQPNSPLPQVAVLSSAWHSDIVLRAVDAIRDSFAGDGRPVAAMSHIEVPGAFELPLHAQRLARSGRFDAVIACGFVVDGGIYRHDFVASAVIDGLMQVQLQSDVPVFSAVLTPHQFHEQSAHQAFFAEHFVLKGREVAQACMATLASLRNLDMRLQEERAS